MGHLGVRPSTLRRYKNVSIPKRAIQDRNIQTEAKPYVNIQKPNEKKFLIRKLLKQEQQLKVLKDLEWILSEALENSQ